MHMCRQQNFILVSAMMLILASASHVAVAQDTEDAEAYQPVTSSDPNIRVDHLTIKLRPLTKAELEIEGEAWIDVLRAKIRQVGAIEIELKELTDDPEGAKKLTEQLVALRTEETGLAERARIVHDALKSKGGDVESAEQFISAVSKISEATDATSYWAALVALVKNWAGRQDGGELWAKRVIAAIVVLVFFWLISRVAGRLVARGLGRYSRTSQLLENFARRTMGGLVLIIGILMALATLGVQIGPMMAALGAGGFIVGFALQETLGSFASGLMIMIYRPFDVDDYVSVSGVEGTVREMSLVSTSLLTVDNKMLVVPNKMAWGDTIVNFTGRELRRIDLIFGIGYEDDIQRASALLVQIANEHDLVLDEPAVAVGVDSLGDSSVNLFCRPWVKTNDYWSVRWDLLQHVKLRFDAEEISFPFPQRDIHLQGGAVPEHKPSSVS